MEGPSKQQNHRISNFINNVLIDFKNLSNALRQVNKQTSQANNSIINKLLLANDRDSLQIVKSILTHLLHIVELKGMNTYILSILTKVISFIKIMEQQEVKTEEKLFSMKVYSEQMSNILYHIIDIIFLLKNKHKDNDMVLRIVQTTFSLIDSQILQYVNYHIIIRIYSICFECYLANPVIENISTSALCALTQIIFVSNKLQDSSTVLTHFLEYVFANKKFTWIKDQQFKGLVWELIILGIKNYPTCQLQHLMSNKKVLDLINQMYKISMQKVFSLEDLKNHKITQNKNKKGDLDKNNFKKGAHFEFMKYFKAFIFLSIYFSIKASSYHLQVVPFKENIHFLKIVYEMERDYRLYILLEGVSLLLIQGSNLLVEDERIILLLQILSKIIEELCLTNIEVEINSEPKDLYIEKMCVDFSKINDSDFVKLTKSSIIKLRKKFEGKIDRKVKTGELLTQRTQVSEKSDLGSNQIGLAAARKKWEKLINNVIRIIRYLTSLNMKESSSQQTVRKIILELQYWYLICPSVRTRNLILQELLSTSTLIDTKLQAVKVSQCVQIGSNIIYGYYESLDTIGLTMILKMMAVVKTSWEDGKGFQELDEVCTMSQKLYVEQKLVNNQKSFSKTIQAFVQSVNSLLADVQQTEKYDRQRKSGKSTLEKTFKMTEYIFSKLQNILNQNVAFIHDEWNFLTGFWISLCSNPNKEIKNLTMNHIETIIMLILNKSQIKQQIILSTYIELSKLQSLQISKLLVSQLKNILLKVNTQQAIVEIFRVAKIVFQTKVCSPIIDQVYELQEMLIKELVFKIKSSDHLIYIIQSITSFSGGKNEQYKTVNLLWNISDHLKMLAQKGDLKEVQRIWRSLFQKLYSLCLYSIHGQTKQACMHTFTQILAQSLHILGSQLFVLIINDLYIELFYILMSFNQKSPKLENVMQVEAMKMGIKNIVKIIRKCLTDKLKNTLDIVNQIIQKLTLFLSSSKGAVTIEYYYELCSFLQFVKGIIKNEIQNKQTIKLQKIQELLNNMQENHVNFDQSCLVWRKKYQPVFKQLRLNFFS